ncbi:NAC domain-containing protein 2-like [Salvia miltiorrhiza]|uniref:NAC domain-containing protein 2-like n=1 Tax=Salvia miltiorrhiza TaxID=226208 RepID=UPI0025AD45FD|nr:NAC domain-containing protein 2-like [Salvia miltiorrhiza]
MDPIKSSLNLPFGYKFDPTSVELLQHYLIPKLRGEKLPSDYVMDLDHLYTYEPCQLPFNQFKHAKNDEAFFFTTDIRKSSEEESQIRTTSNGYWKVYKDHVAVDIAGEVIGFKTKLFFYGVNRNRTYWKMIEYRCHPTRIPIDIVERYIICKIKLKKVEEEEG